MLNKPATQNWSEGCRDSGKPGPSTDRLPPSLLVETRADDRKTPWHEKGGSHTLDAPCDHQLLNTRAQSTRDRSCGENPHANQEHPSAAKQIAEGATNENQRSQK